MSIVNLKPTNPSQEEFSALQTFGLQPYDRSPNDYLRFVAKIFTAWRDPEDTILNYDPFDETYGLDINTEGTTTTLQATSDKSIVAYVDGFQTDYHFTRLTTDAASTDLTSADNVIETEDLITYYDETGQLITITKAKYGEYHRFIIKAGICFIDNQLIQIKEDTEWWFRVPDITTIDGEDQFDTDGNPIFELGQFIVDQVNVYSLLPNRKYKIILSYEYINQFESNSARIQFVTSETAIDEPYLLIGTFSTNEYGVVHQTNPVNESNREIFETYITKPDPNNEGENLYYLRDIDNQYLDKKFIANYKNLFKHLQSQLLSVLADSKIANTFHVREIKEEIDHSVSSGDFVYFNAVENRWFPAIVSRQAFDKVHGLYLRNASEGTDFLFTSGIIEVNNSFKIVNNENLILRNLIPGSEYFLVDDHVLIADNAPFIAPFEFTILEDHFTITTSVIAKASSIKLTMRNIDDTVLPFSINQTFDLDPILGEQRIEQSIIWVLDETQKSTIPKDLNGNYVILSSETGLVATDRISFDVEFDMVLNQLEETRQEIINAFEANDLELNVPYTYTNDDGEEVTEDILITSSDLSLDVTNLSNMLVGPNKPITLLAAVLGMMVPKDYPTFGLIEGGNFQDLTNQTVYSATIDAGLTEVIDDLKIALYEDSADNLGLNQKFGLLSQRLTDTKLIIENLQEALVVTEANYMEAKMKFQSTATELQEAILESRNTYYGYLNTEKILISQLDDYQQQFNALTVKLNELRVKRDSLNEAIDEANLETIDTQTLLDEVNDEITTLNETLDELNSELLIWGQALIDYSTQFENTRSTFESNVVNLYDYDSTFYRVLDATSADYQIEDESKIMPRMAHVLDLIHDLTIEKEAKEIEVKTAYDEYIIFREAYTQDLIGGTMTFAEQLIRLDEVSQYENTYNDRNNELNFLLGDISKYTSVREILYPIFSNTYSKVGVELFADIVSNADPESDWTNTELVTYTVKLSKNVDYDIAIEFIYKEDTANVGQILISAGSMTGTLGLYMEEFPNTYMHNGLPMWIAKNPATGEILDTVFNINKFNDQNLNDFIYSTANTNTSSRMIFTLDTALYAENPIKRDGVLTAYSVLTNLWYQVYLMDSYQYSRELAHATIVTKEDEKETTINLIDYKQRYADSLQDMIDLGTTAVNNYQIEIGVIDSLISYYTTTNDSPLNPPVLGAVYGYDVLEGFITSTQNAINTNEPFVTSSLAAYNQTLQDLADATETALGHYTDTLTEIQNTIDEKERDLLEIDVLFNLYDDKMSILNAIQLNLESVKTSGLFNGEWTTFETLPMNSFEYQNGLENILIELMDQLSLLPYSSYQSADILNYTCSPNGLAYPTDLQNWIWAKSSGKISTRNYPGATSVGIALNNNTLILNIKYNHCSDISEFLNVYGNATDFQDQLVAKYNTSLVSANKLSLIAANTNLNTKIANIATQLYSNPVLVNRDVNGEILSINTNLTSSEMDILDNLTRTREKRELLLRLIIAKYFGSSDNITPTEYLLNMDDSESSFFDTLGNPSLNNVTDRFSPELGLTFGTYIQQLFDSYSSGLDQEILKDMFQRKISLLKDRDILSYIIAVSPEPIINYSAKELELKEDYSSYLIFSLQKERLVIYDNPDPNVLDDFENPAVTDPQDLVLTEAEIANYVLMAENKQAEIDNLQLEIDSKKLNHDENVKDIVRSRKFKSLYSELIFSINKVIDYMIDLNRVYTNIKSDFTAKLAIYDSEFLDYYNRTNKQPNVMWDIFRITNNQRTRWNYTYLVLRIMGMQQELNNIIVSNVIQYSPINAELNELKIKKNTALTEGNETLSFVYQTEIDSLEMKKSQFESLLENYVEEFNVIQRSYSYPTISTEITLTMDKIIDDLYIQDPNEYGLSYAFAPYPAYKELT